MARLADFYPLLKPYAPGVPEPAIDRALIDAADDFCRHSRALRTLADPVRVMPGQGEYELDLEVSGVDAFQVLTVELTRDGEQEGRGVFLEPAHAERHLSSERGEPEKFWMPAPNTVALWPLPKAAATARVTVALRPKLNATVLDDRLMQDWRTAIVAGALVRLLMAPGQSAELAGAYRAMFEAEIRRAAAVAAQSGVGARLRVRAVV